MDKDYKGVMNGDYAIGRCNKLHLKYRYLVRAHVAADSIRRYADTSKESQILDLGVADGRTTNEIRRLLGYGRFIGIEYSTDLIQHAKNLLPDIQIIQGDVLDFPKSVINQMFDVVIALALLEHLPNPVQVVYQACKVLIPGGVFIASCPIPFWDKLSGSLNMDLEEYHMSHIGKIDMINIVKKAGLEFVSYEKFMWAPINILPYLGIWVDPDFAMRVDRFLRKLWIFNWLFVNSFIIGRKPII